MTDKELMQEVLEAMESLHRTGDTQVFDMCAAPVLIPALRERLAQPEQCRYPDCKCATENPCLKGLAQPEQEPVSGVVLDEHGLGALVKNGSEDWHCKKHNARRLYTAPPQRTWVGSGDIEDSNAYATPRPDHINLAAELFVIAQQSPADNGFSDTITRIETWLKNHFSTPQQRTWVGLTDDEIALICGECAASAHKTDDISYARAIEAKLKEKNNE